MMSRSLLIFLGAALIASSCSDIKSKTLFKADLKEKGDLMTLTYAPKMKFKEIIDSADIFLEPDDFSWILGGPIKKGAQITSNEKFSMRIFLFENYADLNAKYKMVLRTFSPDMKIIDSYIVANTAGEVLCDGYITKGLKVFKNCEDGTEYVVTVNEYGEFETEE